MGQTLRNPRLGDERHRCGHMLAECIGKRFRARHRGGRAAVASVGRERLAQFPANREHVAVAAKRI